MERARPGHGEARLAIVDRDRRQRSASRSGRSTAAERTLRCCAGSCRSEPTWCAMRKAAELPIEELVPGDVVLLESGDRSSGGLPADRGLRCPGRSAVITGEALLHGTSGRTEQRRRAPAWQQHRCSPAPRWSPVRPRRSSSPPACTPSSARSRASPEPRMARSLPLRKEIAHLSRLIGILSVADRRAVLYRRSVQRASRSGMPSSSRSASSSRWCPKACFRR